MSNRLSQEKANAIAAAYCTNHHKKVKALITAGYSEPYAKTTGLKLYDNARVKEAIVKIEAKAVTVTVYTVIELAKMYQKGYDVAEKQGNPTGMATNATGIANVFGMLKTIHVTEDIPEELTQSEMEQAQAEAQAAIRLKISRPA